MMSKVQEYIKNRSENSTEFTQQIEIERKRLELAMKLTELRKSTGLTQKELSEKIGKPQSTISRIETGEMNPTVGLVIEIANGIGKNFVPIFE